MTKIAIDSNLKSIRNALDENGVKYTVIPDNKVGQIKASDFDILIVSEEN